MIRYSFFGYALATAIILIICGLAYQVFFSRKMRPWINRIALLSILFLGLIGPCMAHLLLKSGADPQVNIIVGSPMVAHVIVEKPATITFTSMIKSALPILNLIYITGIVLMSISCIVSIIRLLIIKRKSRKTIINGLQVYVHDNKLLSSFSWLKNIFIFSGARQEDLPDLLTHETAHVKLYHWIDILIMQVAIIFQWFNPAVWALKKELQQVHEYQADNKVIHSGTDRSQYQYLLLRNVSGGRLPGLVAGIRGRSIKKRFQMMHKTEFKSNFLLRSMTICLGVVCGILLIQMPAVAEVVETREPVSKENKVLLNCADADKILYYIDNKTASYEEMANFDSSRISCVEVFNGEQKVVGIVTKEYNEKNHVNLPYKIKGKEMLPLKNLVKENGTQLDREPYFEGGENRLKGEIAYYLENRPKWDIQGIVEVGFTVNRNGELCNFHILKSLDSELDVTAVKAIRSLSGKWQPAMIKGEPVDVELRLEVKFSV